MSLLLRSLLREPLVTRPFSRALRRTFDDDWWADDLPAKRARRSVVPVVESPISIMDDMNRQMNAAMSRMQDFVDDLDVLDSWVTRFDNNNRSPMRGLRGGRRRGIEGDTVVKRTESGGLQLALDVGDFKPEDLKIKLVDDNLIVEASSESSGKDSYRKSHLKRWFKLPEDCKLDDIRSKLTTDNRLLIDLPSSKPEDQQQARSIPIDVEKPAPEIEGSKASGNAANRDQSKEHQQQAQAAN